jgi:hypothetical protein
MVENMVEAESSAAHAGNGQEIDFVTFVMSLATSVLMQLGENEEGTPTGPADLPLAKQTIDIIGMLRDKTRGNLTPDEARVVDGVLYDLRMRYLKQSRG